MDEIMRTSKVKTRQFVENKNWVCGKRQNKGRKFRCWINNFVFKLFVRLNDFVSI